MGGFRAVNKPWTPSPRQLEKRNQESKHESRKNGEDHSIFNSPLSEILPSPSQLFHPKVRSNPPQKPVSPATRVQPIRWVKPIPSIEVQVPKLSSWSLTSGARFSVSTSSSDTIEYMPSAPLTPSSSASFGASSSSYCPTSTSSSGSSLQVSSRRLKQAATSSSSVNLQLRHTSERLAKPSRSIAKTQHPNSMSAPQPTSSSYTYHEDNDVIIFDDRVHCCNDLMARHERRVQETNEEMLSLFQIKTKEEDEFRVAMKKILKGQSREQRAKGESSESHNGLNMTTPRLHQQFEQMHVEDRSSNPALEIHEEQNHTRMDPDRGNKERKKKRTRVLDSGEANKDDQQANRGKKRIRGAVEGHSSPNSNDMAGLNQESKRERRKKKKERKRERNMAEAMNSTQPSKIPNEGSSKAFEKANTKEREKVTRDHDTLDIENGQHHREKIKPTSKLERAAKQSSKGKERMIEDGQQAGGNSRSQNAGIPTSMATEPEQVSSSNDGSGVLSQSGSAKGLDKFSGSKKHKESGLQLETRRAELANKELLSNQMNLFRASTPYPDTFADEDEDENVELSSQNSSCKKSNNYVDLSSFVQDIFDNQHEDENIGATSPRHLDSFMLNSRQGACHVRRSHTVPPRTVNVESNSEARSAQNHMIGFKKTTLPTFESSSFTAAPAVPTHSNGGKETLVMPNPSPTSRPNISTATAITAGSPSVSTDDRLISTSTPSATAGATNSPPRLPDQPRPKSRRVAELELRHRRRPKDDIPMDERQNRKELIEIAKRPDKFGRHEAAPHVFNFPHGKLYKEHLDLIVIRPDEQKFTAEQLKRIL